MEPLIPIENLLVLRDADASARKAAQEAFVAALAEAGEATDVLAGENAEEAWVRFHCEWEPPFRAAKKTSDAHASVSVTLYSDSFAASHWVSKADYLAGKGRELTLSRVDDDFDGVFAEMFDTDLASWEANRSAAFKRYV